MGMGMTFEPVQVSGILKESCSLVLLYNGNSNSNYCYFQARKGQPYDIQCIIYLYLLVGLTYSSSLGNEVQKSPSARKRG